MKFSPFPILLAFSAFQVDLALSSVESRIQELSNLWNQAHTVASKLQEFKKKEIDSRSDAIFNQTIWSLDHATNLTHDTQKEIEDEADTFLAENEFIDIDSCLEAALNALKEIIEFDCGAFGSCHKHSVEEIKIIVEELTEYIKIIEEIKKQIIYVRDENCRNYTGYAKELCLYCRIPRFEVTIVSHTKKIERFKRGTIKYIEQIIHHVTSCLAKSTDKTDDKIHQIAKDVKECFAQLCNAPSTTVLPETSPAPTIVAPTTIA